ncbi:hypothetical protein [uncultured Massilia sp.]|uniref:hypothetical protein n=1 Tax=uncultured Massilia sp. TaxID=169973 RepID=UPI0025842659|nr:hypothetical protein [uncultured Massilia sp.]
MTVSSLRTLTAVALAACFMMCMALPALSAPAPPAGEQDAAMVASLKRELARTFALPKDAALDPALRKEAEDIGAAHLERIGRLLPAWLDEEKRAGARPGEVRDPNYLYAAVFARLLNELALWHLDTGDARYEEATLSVLKASPQACQMEGDSRFQDYASRIRRIQAMPPAFRPAVLATERQLLERWGKPRAVAPAWPLPLPQDAAAEAIDRLRSDGARVLPLPPVLAASLLAEGEAYGKLGFEDRCILQQWWLRASLAQGAAPAAVLNAFRYGTLMTATDRFGNAFDPPGSDVTPPDARASPAYPSLAQRFDVTGSTTVTRELDAAGKPLRASVTAREITVRGIRGMRPVVFENTFDAASVQFALQGSASPGARLPEVFNMNWSLDPAASAAPKKTGGKTP